MRSLALLVPFLWLSTGCGLGSTVVGEGPPDDGNGDVAVEEDAEVRRTLSAMSSSGPLFECTYDSGGWPGMSEGRRITLSRNGANVTLDGRVVSLRRVDASARSGGYLSYELVGNGVSIVISGTTTTGNAVPNSIYFHGSTSDAFICRERFMTGFGVFAERELDTLVTVTNGDRR
jgi:hypothetical protein